MSTPPGIDLRDIDAAASKIKKELGVQNARRK
jgi:hypothetical protein